MVDGQNNEIVKEINLIPVFSVTNLMPGFPKVHFGTYLCAGNLRSSSYETYNW